MGGQLRRSGGAELLQTLLPYWRGWGIAARGRVVRGAREFYRVTKHLHHWQHGSCGDGGDLDADEFTLLDRRGKAHAGRPATGRRR